VSDRPKTMAERTTQRVVGGKLVPQRTPKPASDDAGALPDAAMGWTGTPLKTALAKAQAAQGLAPETEPGDAPDGETGAADLLDSEASAASGKSQPLGLASRGEAAASGHKVESRSAIDKGGAAGGNGARPTKRPPRAAGSPKASHAFAATRAVARKLALQAIYRWLLNDAPWQDLVKEFGEAEDMPNADPQYFRELVEGVWAARTSLDERLGELVDRPVQQLDPVEHAVLLVGLFELSARPDVPYRVVINEAVGLAKRFGATDGHKFVNAVLDRAARILRAGEN
jgi:transcription antitermination protein NusB